MTYLVETPDKTGVSRTEVPPEGEQDQAARPQFTITVPLAKPAADRRTIELRALALDIRLQAKRRASARSRATIWNVPVAILGREEAGRSDRPERHAARPASDDIRRRHPDGV